MAIYAESITFADEIGETAHARQMKTYFLCARLIAALHENLRDKVKRANFLA